MDVGTANPFSTSIFFNTNRVPTLKDTFFQKKIPFIISHIRQSLMSDRAYTMTTVTSKNLSLSNVVGLLRRLGDDGK